MSNRNKPRKGRGRGAPRRDAASNMLFELALRGGRDMPRFDPRTERKTLQLCRQVQRALILALAGECDDELLRDVSVEGVDPAGGGGHLLVRVNVPAGTSVMQTIARLNGRAGKLRSIVAASICRKRAPTLSFIAVGNSGGEDHAG